MWKRGMNVFVQDAAFMVRVTDFTTCSLCIYIYLSYIYQLYIQSTFWLKCFCGFFSATCWLRPRPRRLYPHGSVSWQRGSLPHVGGWRFVGFMFFLQLLVVNMFVFKLLSLTPPFLLLFRGEPRWGGPLWLRCVSAPMERRPAGGAAASHWERRAERSPALHRSHG